MTDKDQRGQRAREVLARQIADLKRLSEKASDGAWLHYDKVFRKQFGNGRVTEIQRYGDGKAIISWGGFDGLPDATARKKNHNARFIVELVNFFRKHADDLAEFAAERPGVDPAPVKQSLTTEEGKCCGEHIAGSRCPACPNRPEGYGLSAPPIPAGGGEGDLRPRKAVNTILGELLAPLIPDLCERVRVGNHACSLILASLSPAPVKQSLTTGEGETAVIEDCARRALQTTEMARTDVVNPVNGSAPYSYVSFHGQRVVFSDDEFTISQHRDAGTGKAAAYATKINDALFDLAKRAAANTIRLSAPPILATGGEGKVRTCKHCLAALSPTPVAGGGE